MTDTSITAEIDPSGDGRILLKITTSIGMIIPVAIEAPAAATFLRQLQDAVVREIAARPEQAGGMSPLELGVLDSTSAQGPGVTGLMVSTDRIGWIVLLGSLATLEQLHEQLGRALVDVRARNAGAPLN